MAVSTRRKAPLTLSVFGEWLSVRLSVQPIISFLFGQWVGHRVVWRGWTQDYLSGAYRKLYMSNGFLRCLSYISWKRNAWCLVKDLSFSVIFVVYPSMLSSLSQHFQIEVLAGDVFLRPGHYIIICHSFSTLGTRKIQGCLAIHRWVKWSLRFAIKL